MGSCRSQTLRLGIQLTEGATQSEHSLAYVDQQVLQRSLQPALSHRMG